MRDALIASLKLDPAATDQQILDAVAALQTAKADATTAAEAEKTAKADAEKLANQATAALNNEKTAHQAAATALQAERKARIDLILSNAIAQGKITPAQRPQWATDLEKDLDAKLLELSNVTPALNTQPKTTDLGARNSNAIANRDASTRRDHVLMLVNERITKTGSNYTEAYAAIKKENPALFAEMQNPK